MSSSTYSRSQSPARTALFTHNENPEINVIVPRGLLLSELNHGLSIAAFKALVETEGKLFDLKVIMPLFMVIDRQVKAGKNKIDPNNTNNDQSPAEDGLTASEFRNELRKILELVTTSDADIDKAFNAMLGTLIATETDKPSPLKVVIENLKKQPSKMFHIVSATNPIHDEALFKSLGEEYKYDPSASNPLPLNGLSLHVSYLQKATSHKVRCSDTNLYDEVVANQQLDKKPTMIVLALESDSQNTQIKARDEANANNRKIWAESKGFTIVNYKRGVHQSIADAIVEYEQSQKQASMVASV